MSDVDPLLLCLQHACNWYEIPYVEEGALAGLPLDNQKLIPSLFLRAAERLGIKAKIKIEKYRELQAITCPFLLLLDDDRVVMVTDITQNSIRYIDPAQQGKEIIADKDYFKADYIGYIITLHKIDFSENKKGISAIKKNWFWTILRDAKALYGNLFLASILINLFVFIVPLFIRNIYNSAIPNNATDSILALALGMLIFFIFNFIISVYRSYLLELISGKIGTTISTQLFEHTLNIKMEEKLKTMGESVSLFKGFFELRDFLTISSLVSIIDLPFMILYIFGVCYFGGALGLITFAALVSIIVSCSILEKPARGLQAQIKSMNAKEQSLLHEIYVGLETIKATGMENEMRSRWAQVINKNNLLILERTNVNLSNSISRFIISLTMMIIVAYGVKKVVDGTMTIGDLIFCTILSRRILMVSQISTLIFKWGRVRAVINQLNNYVLKKIDGIFLKTKFHRKQFHGYIEFDRVSFCYPEQTVKAIDNMSVKINPKEKIIISGKFGAGKTTFMRLLTSLYTNYTGNIYIDNIFATELNPIDIRSHLKLSRSENQLFPGTVEENIRLGNPGVSQQRIVDICKLIGLDEFISALTAGYQTQLGEAGSSLPVGYRQLIIMARTLVNDAPVLLFDDPLPNVDAKTTKKVAQSVITAFCDRTIIWVDNRLSMLNVFERVLYVDKGKIVIDDTPENAEEKISADPMFNIKPQFNN